MHILAYSFLLLERLEVTTSSATEDDFGDFNFKRFRRAYRHKSYNVAVSYHLRASYTERSR